MSHRSFAPVVCIDIGNTHADVALMHGTERSLCERLPSQDIVANPEHLLHWLAPWLNEAQGMASCCVVPAAQPALDALEGHSALPMLRLRHDCCPGLAIVYPNPHEIGADLLAAAIGAHTLFAPPVLALSLGTATAGVLVSERGFEGGMIAPGLNMMIEALHQRTALLPQLDPEFLARRPVGIGSSTRSAMHIGCRIGFAGLVEGLVEHMRQHVELRFEQTLTVVLSGGSAELLAQTELPGHHVPGLNLIGLATAFHTWQTI